MGSVFIVYSEHDINYSDPNYFWDLKNKIYSLLDNIREERLLIIIPQGLFLNLADLANDYRVKINDFDSTYDIVLDTMLIETEDGLKYEDKKTAEKVLNLVKDSGLLYRLITKDKYEELPEINTIKNLVLSEDINIAVIQALIYYGPNYFILPETSNLPQDQIYMTFQKTLDRYDKLIGKDDIETLVNLYTTSVQQNHLNKWCKENNINIEKILQVFSTVGKVQNITIKRNKLIELGKKLTKMSDYIFIDENYTAYKIDITSMPRIQFYIPNEIYAMKITNNVVTIYMI